MHYCLSLSLAALLLTPAFASSRPLTNNVRRTETEGTACSPEGQWNCMPDTWQRCAAGQWSVVMDLAQGTICTPQGLSEEITIEHDGSFNGEGGRSANGGYADGLSSGLRSIVGMYLPLMAAVIWMHRSGIL